jgi:wyosine [tRNA(Phe)-imidazoG37] synthetase (radical SAM superfamily)
MPKYLYGPVLSRRLGRSLGVDLVRLKTCTYNCIYCQLGPTATTRLVRADYVPVDEVIEEVKQYLDKHVPPDFITLGGSGEPTLHASFGRIAERIKELGACRIALLTNGALFYLPAVRAACKAIDVILPTLDAADEETFRRIHRPHPDITLARVVEGLTALRAEFKGEIWLEVFLVPGFNTSDSDIEKLKGVLECIRPDRIQLNTAVRPPAEKFVEALSRERLEQIRAMLGPRAEVVAEPEGPRPPAEGKVTEQDVLQMLGRRPCTAEDVADGLSIHPAEAAKHIGQLLGDGLVIEVREGGRRFYRAR